MFKKIRECLDNFESIIKKLNNGEKISKEEEAFLDYFEMHMALALIQSLDANKVARVILANDD